MNGSFPYLSMNIIDLKKDFDQNNVIFNDITFSHFLNDLKPLASNLECHSDSEVILLKENDPYYFILKFFAILLNKKIPLLVNDKFTDLQLETIQKNVTYTSFKINPNLKKQFNFQLDHEQHFYLLSSGSTGDYKIIVHDLKNVIEHVKIFNQALNPQKNEAYYLNLPLFHVSGLMIFFRAFFTGGHIKTNLDHPLDYISLVPTQLEKIFSQNDEKMLHLLKNTKAVFVGGAKFTTELKKKMSDYHISFYETYGMTETLSFVCLNHKIMSNVDLIINQAKMVTLNTPTLFLGQIVNHQFIKTTIPYITADQGLIDQDNFYFEKRADSLINCGGEKISLNFIQNEIHQMQLFEFFHITSVADLKWGEKVICFYQNPKLDHFEKILKEKLGSLLFPKKFIPFNFDLIKDRKISKIEWEQFYLDTLFDSDYFDHHQTQTIVVFNGFMESKKDWYFIKDVFKNRFNYLFIALPGHDHTKVEDFFNTEDLFIKLTKFIKQKCTNPIFIAYSQGGRVAYQLVPAFTHSKFFIISASLGLDSIEDKKKRLNDDLKLFDNVKNNEDLKQFFYQWYQNPIFGNYHSFSTFDSDIQKKLEFDFNHWKKSLEILSIGQFPTLDENLKLIKNLNQIDYIYGENDIKYNIFSKYMRSHAIKNAYHNLHRTHQDDLVKLLQTLL